MITGVVVLALGATVITVAVAYWRRVGRKEEAVSVPQALPSNVHEQLSGYSFTRSDEGRQIFTIHAARTVAFKEGGTTVLDDVLVEFFGRANDRHDVLRTSRCEYNSETGDFFGPGKVEMEFSERPTIALVAGGHPHQPVFAETSAVSFKHQQSLVVTEEPVRFRVGLGSGSARGLTYAVKEGWLELKRDVAGQLNLKSGEEPPVQLAASKMRYDRSRAEIVLWGPLEIVQGNRRLQGERGTLSLDDHNRITRAALEGRVRGSDSSAEGSLEFSASHVQGAFDPATGQPRNLLAEGDVVGESRHAGATSHLTAQTFEVALEGPHPEPRTARASGKVRLTVEPTPALNIENPRPPRYSAERKILTASEMRFAFRSDGRSLQQADTVGESKLVLVPLDAKAGERVITAGRFLMAFDEQSRLESLRGRAGTRMVLEPPPVAPPGSVPDETSSDRLDATFDTATGTLRTVEQAGDFQFREGDRQASSARASYLSLTRFLTLTGGPQLWDPTTRIRAERIVFDLTTDTAEGLGKVQSTHFEVADPPGPGPSEVRPAGSSDPTNLLADRVIAVRRDQFVHYEGHVRAWHGQDVIESTSLDVSRKERRLTSGFRVLTSFIQPASGQGAPVASVSRPTQRGTRPVTVRADRLEYLDLGRKASYRGNVQVQAENTLLQTDHLDVFLSKGGSAEASQIERAVADGHVTVTQPGRRAAGEHGDYDAAPGKIVLTGGPPTIYDTQEGFMTGQRLTFYTHDDRLLVNGGNKSPTLSKHRVAH